LLFLWHEGASVYTYGLRCDDLRIVVPDTVAIPLHTDPFSNAISTGWNHKSFVGALAVHIYIYSVSHGKTRQARS
jgi:hypothetical protein